MPVTVHDRILDEAPAYLLGELDGRAAALVEAHLAGCAACRAEFERLSESVEALRAPTADVDPPARLRAAVLDAARQEGPPVPLAPPAAQSRRPFDWARWAPAALASAAALAFAISASATGARAQTTRAAYRQVLAENAALTTQLASARHSLQLAVLQLGATAAGGQAVASLAVAQTAGTAQVVLVARGLPPLAAGQVYQLWYLNGGAPVSGGLLQVSGTTAELRARLGPATVVRAAAVSREPHPGDSAPLGPIVLQTA